MMFWSPFADANNMTLCYLAPMDQSEEGYKARFYYCNDKALGEYPVVYDAFTRRIVLAKKHFPISLPTNVDLGWISTEKHRLESGKLFRIQKPARRDVCPKENLSRMWRPNLALLGEDMKP
eukprot:Trichotokara_eunicae@DN8767_c0_g1_i1.p1